MTECREVTRSEMMGNGAEGEREEIARCTRQSTRVTEKGKERKTERRNEKERRGKEQKNNDTTIDFITRSVYLRKASSISIINRCPSNNIVIM